MDKKTNNRNHVRLGSLPDVWSEICSTCDGTFNCDDVTIYDGGAQCDACMRAEAKSETVAEAVSMRAAAIEVGEVVAWSGCGLLLKLALVVKTCGPLL
jgi:hypothetical protein